MLSQVSPLIALASLIAGVVGAFVGVKVTASSAKDMASKTAEIVNGLVTSVAVLQVQVTHLSDGLKAATEELDEFRASVRSQYQ
jgi:uncharacterized membrane protein YeaQ/YmgE (transglycosylase-associated protein family)